MPCLRCGGLMVSDRFYDYWDDTGQNEFEGYRCLVCGEVVDQVIVVSNQVWCIERCWFKCSA